MGYIRHHAIIVTASYGEHAATAREHAIGLGLIVSPLMLSEVNGYETFLVAPDGSKLGWETASRHAIARESFVKYLESLVYEDGSSPVKWAYVQYGDDEGVTKVLRDSDYNYRVQHS